MRFTHLALDNFLSYETQELDLEGLDYVAIAGRNGSGKSSLALAIAWALFGTARVKGDADSVVRDGQSDAAVTLDFTTEGTRWRVIRSKKRTKSAKVRLFSLNTEGEWAAYGDHLNSTAQARIEELVGMSEDAFYSLSIIDGDSGVRFIKADSGQRRDILLNLLPEMAVWGQMEEKAREMLAADRQSVEAEQARLEADEERVASTKEQAAAAEAEFDEMDADALRASLPEIESDINHLAQRMDAAAADEKERLEEAQRTHKTKQTELRSELSIATSNFDSATRSVRTLTTLVDDKNNASKDASALADDIESAKEAASAADAAFEAVDERRAEVKELKAKAAEERDAASGLKAAIAANRKSLRGLTQMQDDHAAQCPTCQTHLDADTLDALVSRIEADVERDSAAEDKHVTAAEDYAARAEELRDLINAAADAADAAEDKVERLVERYERAGADAKRYAGRIKDFLADNDFDSESDVDAASKTAKKKVSAAQSALDDYVEDARADIERLQKAYDEAVDAAAEGKDAERLSALRADKRDTVEKIRVADTLSGRIETLKSSLRDTVEGMRERKDAIKGTVERISALEQVVSACRPQGIPSMLLDGVLAPIECEATKILNSVPGGEGWMLRFEQARALKSRAGAREVLDIIVTLPTGVERPIESLSAGETVRVSMALVFAMIRVLGARRGGDAPETVFLDEPLGPLDQEAVPAFVEVLRSAVSTGSLSSVMVVTHDQRVVEALPQRIEVEREETGVSVASIVA